MLEPIIITDPKQKLSHVLPEIPTNVNLAKKLPGIGATHMEIHNKRRNSIVIEPNVPVIQGKCRKHNKNEYILCGVYEGKTVDDVVEYLSEEREYYKIMTTPESLPKVFSAAEKLKIDLFGDWFCLMDESHLLVKDVDYREDIVFPMTSFFRFRNKALVTATPIDLSDPRFKEQGFELLEVVANYEYRYPITVLHTNNPFIHIRELVKKAEKPICFFINLVDYCYSVIKDLEIEDKSSIFCAPKSQMKIKHDRADIHRPVRKGGDADGDACLPAFFEDLLPAGLEHRCAEGRAHGGPDHLPAPGVGAAIQQHHGNIHRVGGPQDGADVARVLDPVQDQHALFRLKILLRRDLCQEHGPLGCLHRGDGRHHVLGDPDNADPLRDRSLDALGEDHRLKLRAVFHRFFQQFHTVAHEKAGLPALGAAGEQLLHLLQKGIFPAADPFFHVQFLLYTSCLLSTIIPSPVIFASPNKNAPHRHSLHTNRPTPEGAGRFFTGDYCLGSRAISRRRCRSAGR